MQSLEQRYDTGGYWTLIQAPHHCWPEALPENVRANAVRRAFAVRPKSISTATGLSTFVQTHAFLNHG